MQLDLTHAALSDLQSVRAYTLETWGEDQEEKYLNEMWDRFAEILADPTRRRSRDDLFPGCQLAHQGKHVILFRVKGEVLQIVRVLHSAMDFKRHISDKT
jgi:toxin ParE1/3/4